MSKKQSRTKTTSQTRIKSAERPAWHNAWARQSAVRQHVISVVFLLLVAVIFYAPIHFSGKQLIAGDTVNWRSMAQSMIEYEEETGDVALWAGHTFGGMPGYMISPELTVPQVDSVLRVLRTFFWPTSHLMLMFLGMYVLAWYVTRDSLASILGAVAYGLSTYMPVILVAGHNSKFIALAWAPWMLVAFAYALQKHTKVSALLFAVALAANLRAGHVQITYYVTIAAGIWWLVEGVYAFRSEDRISFLKATGVLVLGSVLGLLMVAEPYLAHAELAPFTTRGAATGGLPGGMGWSYAMAWSQGVGELLTLLVSDVYGGSGGTYWGPKTFTGGPHHFGAIIIALGILAGWKSRDRVNLALLIGVGLLTAFSLGEHFAILNRPMFDYFPMFSAFRVPETWLSIVALLGALLAARGVALLRKESKVGSSIWRIPTIQSFGGVFAVLLLLMVFGSTILSFEKPLERDQLLSQIQRQYPSVSASDPQVASVIDQEIATRQVSRMDLFDSDTKRVALFVLLAIALIVLMIRGTIPYWVTASGLILLVTIDLTGVGRRYLNENVLSAEKTVESKVPEYGFDTYLKEQVAEAGGDGAFRVLSLEFGMSPLTNARPSFHYESMGGYSAAKLRVYQDYLDHILFNESGTGINDAALNLANIKYVVAGQGIPGMDPVFQDEQTGMIVSQNPNVLPRAFLVDDVTVLSSSEEVWSRLAAPDFDPATEAIVVSEDFSAMDKVGGRADSASVKLVSTAEYSAQDMSFDVNTDRERLLVISEVYYAPGWTATVNGSEAPIYQVDHLLRGVIVPAGESQVRLSFSPDSFRNGRLFSGLGTLITYGLLLFFGWMGWKKKKQGVLA